MSQQQFASNRDNRVYCNLDQLLALKQQASYIKFDARYRPAGLLAGRHRSRLRGRGMNFEELRGYRSGDSVRNIDWKASAHSRQKLVKVFTEETDRPTVLLVDQRRSLFFGSRERTKSVTAAEVAATLAWMVLDSGDRLGGVVFNNEQQTFLRPTRSSTGAMRILQMICDYNQQLQPGANSIDDAVTLNDVLARSSNYIGNNGTLILVSDCDGLVEKHLDHLEYLAHQHNVLVFLIADPLEYSIADVERLIVSDGDQQMELSADAGASERFAAQYSEQLRSIKDRVAAHGLPFGVIDTVQAVDQQLQALFGIG
ncbi:MAG: DUF58 domain-containing protein [Halioglobus sp.]